MDNLFLCWFATFLHSHINADLTRYTLHLLCGVHLSFRGLIGCGINLDGISIELRFCLCRHIRPANASGKDVVGQKTTVGRGTAGDHHPPQPRGTHRLTSDGQERQTNGLSLLSIIEKRIHTKMMSALSFYWWNIILNE